MVIIYHNHTFVEAVYYNGSLLDGIAAKSSMVTVLKAMSLQYPEASIAWCDSSLKGVLATTSILKQLMKQPNMLHSYTSTQHYYLGSSLGYVEQSPFMNVNFAVHYPTWQMSAEVGVTSSQVLQHIDSRFYDNDDFSYFLNSVAKTYMPQGLLCYATPSLVQQQKGERYAINSAKQYVQFKFIVQHYKKSWLFFYFMSLLLFEKRFAFLALLKVIFVKQTAYKKHDFSLVAAEKSMEKLPSIDVIIPTIGRKEYLYDVLVDLKNQTHLPKKVIIVEQNPVKNSTSELEYLSTENWPFEIIHEFTNIAGVCRARNIALDHATSDYLFLADDDIRIELSFIKEALTKMINLDVKGVTFSCLNPNQNKSYFIDHQTGIFGSGCSIIENSGIKFDQKFEFGFGEDIDFGMQLRNSGTDVFYFSTPEIIHLKAPMGGFRTKFIHKWDKEKIQPKPSPTVMYVKQKYSTKEQLLGYKMLLFLKELKRVSMMQKLTFVRDFQKKWNASLFWVTKL